MLWPHLKARVLPHLARRFCPLLRIWSAGCACGEEAYSLAMVWNELGRPCDLHLLASDMGADCLQRARAGIYGRGSLRGVPEALRLRYFDGRKGERQFVLRQHLLPPVRWQVHDLLGEPPDDIPRHLFLLRNNLLTYYRGADLRAAFARILSVLAPGGCLVIGSHEQLPFSDVSLKRDTDCPWVYWRENDQ